jgi:hypothetical protein
VDEVNGILTQDAPTLQTEIEEKQRELADVDKAIGTLLDLAEKFGAESAGARLLEREGERNDLMQALTTRECRHTQPGWQTSLSHTTSSGVEIQDHGTGDDQGGTQPHPARDPFCLAPNE